MRYAHQLDTEAARGTPPVAAEPDRACAGEDTALFFPARGGTAMEAIEICSRCPHRQPCLDWAIETGQTFGVWGGTTADQRARMLRGAA